MSSNDDTITTNTTNQTNQLIESVDKLIMKILDFINCGDDANKLNEIKLLFNEYFEKFKDRFLHKINYMQSHIINCIHSYALDNLERADEIIKIMLSYNVMPGIGIFKWGYRTTHLESLELAFKHGVIPCDDVNYRQYTMINAITYIVHSKRNADQIIKALDIFIKYGYNFDHYYVNFIISWNPPVIKYILSLITRLDDYMGEYYMGELISALTQMSRYDSINSSCNIKNVIDHILEIVISRGKLNHQDDNGCTDLHYICSDYTSLQAINLNKVPYYEYLIERLLLNGADINILDNWKSTALSFNPKVYRIVENKKLEAKLHHDLVTFVNNILRNEAIVFVKAVSWYLLPDIADVVFGHLYKFDTEIHSDLARAVYES